MSENDNLDSLIQDIKSIKKSIERLEILEKPIFVQDGDKKKVLRIPDICFITTNSKGLDILFKERAILNLCSDLNSKMALLG